MDLTITLDLSEAEIAYVIGKCGSESAAIESLALQCVDIMEEKI